jgi:uncharacterized repeat protein (TIGR03803 family)
MWRRQWGNGVRAVANLKKAAAFGQEKKMASRAHCTRRLGLIGLLSMACAVGSWSGAAAHTYTFHRLYSFCAEASCTDGAEPLAGLMMDQAGKLYGTTAGGGAQNAGTVFELTPGDTRKWKDKVLYSFCSQANCADGNRPITSLIIDTSGNLYGTTQQGGPYGNNDGVAFRLQPNATGNKWKYKQLYAFCAEQSCLDGSTPSSGLAYAGEAAGSPYDGTSALFGTTGGGGSGAFAPAGVAFRLDPQNRRWRQTVVYNFCSATDCADGASPNAPVVDSAGRLWGTTSSGGNHRGGGVLYSISGRQESVEYVFCSDTDNCLDGSFPTSPVFLDNFGRIVGTTPLGGSDIANGFGTLFAISGGLEQVLYTFCPRGGNCAHGDNPSSGVIEDNSGNIFGMTAQGDPDGVVYEFRGGTERVLHTFCTVVDCTDGSTPSGGLIMDSVGNLYGTTQGGGAFNGGTVFELQY